MKLRRSRDLEQQSSAEEEKVMPLRGKEFFNNYLRFSPTRVSEKSEPEKHTEMFLGGELEGTQGREEGPGIGMDN